MRTTRLWQSGDSVAVSLPKAFLDQLGLKSDTAVDIRVVGDTIVIARRAPGRIGLEARLALCDFSQAMSDEEWEWLDDPAVGNEAI